MLEPNHDYVLNLTFPDARSAPGVAAPIEIAFRTGQGDVEAPAMPDVEGFSDELSSSDGFDAIDGSACPDLLRAQDCFDDGPLALRSIQTRGDKPLAWLIDDDLIPATCVDPQLLRGSLNPFASCISLRAIGAGGRTSAKTELCFPGHSLPADGGRAELRTDELDEVDRPAKKKVDGCSTASGRSTFDLALVLLALTSRRRSKAPHA